MKKNKNCTIPLALTLEYRQVSAPLRAKRRKKRETSGKRQEARDKRQETRAEIELFAVRFLCACLPQAGLCVFARKKKKEARGKRQEARSERQEPRAEKR